MTTSTISSDGPVRRKHLTKRRVPAVVSLTHAKFSSREQMQRVAPQPTVTPAETSEDERYDDDESFEDDDDAAGHEVAGGGNSPLSSLSRGNHHHHQRGAGERDEGGRPGGGGNDLDDGDDDDDLTSEEDEDDEDDAQMGDPMDWSPRHHRRHQRRSSSAFDGESRSFPDNNNNNNTQCHDDLDDDDEEHDDEEGETREEQYYAYDERRWSPVARSFFSSRRPRSAVTTLYAQSHSATNVKEDEVYLPSSGTLTPPLRQLRRLEVRNAPEALVELSSELVVLVLKCLPVGERHTVASNALCRRHVARVREQRDVWLPLCSCSPWRIRSSATRGLSSTELRKLHRRVLTGVDRARRGTVHDVADAMCEFADVAGVQRRCLDRLVSMLHCERVRKQALGSKVTGAVVNSLRHFRDDAQLQAVALHCVVFLARPIGGAEGMVFSRGMASEGVDAFLRGGIDGVLEAMATHLHDADVQAMGCWSLVNLALNRKQKLLLLEKNCLDRVVAAMTNHPQALEVQFRALFALINLVIPEQNPNDQNQHQQQQQNNQVPPHPGLEQQQQQHQQQQQQQQQEPAAPNGAHHHNQNHNQSNPGAPTALALPVFLSTTPTPTTTTAAERYDRRHQQNADDDASGRGGTAGNVLDHVLAAMHTFYESDKLIRCGCLVLHNLSLREANIPHLLAAGVAGPLERAARNHKDHDVQRSAASTLRRLGLPLMAHA